MPIIRYRFSAALLAATLFAVSGCGDSREKIIEAVDRDIETRALQTQPAEGFPDDAVTVILEVIEIPISSMEPILANFQTASEGNAIRREVEIAMRMEEAHLQDLLVARGEMGNASKIESLMRRPLPLEADGDSSDTAAKDKSSIGSSLEFTPTRISDSELSLRIAHHFSHSLSSQPIQSWIPSTLDSESEVRVRSGDYTLVSAAKPTSPEDSKKDSIFLLFLRADFL